MHRAAPAATAASAYVSRRTSWTARILKRIALVTGANQEVGFQVAKELAEDGVTVLVGSRNFRRGEEAAARIGAGAVPVQLDVTDRHRSPRRQSASATSSARLDLLVNNAAISNTRMDGLSLADYVNISLPSNVSLDEVRAIWDTNVFGVLAVTQAMLPLLRLSADARIVNVSSNVGSLGLNADPNFPYRKIFTPGYARFSRPD